MFLASSPVLAKTLTFEDVAPPGGLRNINPSNPLTTQGYTFSDVNGEAAVFAPGSGYSMVGDATAVLGFAASDTITLTAPAARPFDLMQLLLGPSTIAGGPTDVTLTGYDFGTNIMETATFLDLTTATLETLDWTDLGSVTISASTDTSIDDLVVGPVTDVPEPASTALLCAGLLGLVMVTTRRAA